MLGITRVVAVDDCQKDLEVLVRGLNQAGAACVGVHYTSDPGAMNIAECQYVRVVFMDINLLGGPPGTDSSQMFSLISDVLSRINPTGPYLLTAWTRLDHEADGLRDFLNERLTGAAKPFAVVPLQKECYINENSEVTDLPGLIQAITDFTKTVPALAVLSEWEEKVSSAAAETLASVTTLGTSGKTGEEQQKDVSRAMNAMVTALVGQQDPEANPFRAVNETLLPVLTDHVAVLQIDSASENAWRRVVGNGGAGQSISHQEAARLNRVFHIAEDIGADRGAERGAVIPLSCAMLGDRFEATFGIPEDDAAVKLFRCRNFQAGSVECRWVLIQAQAACDYAQNRAGPLPFYLGMDVVESSLSTSSAPQALWQSPRFEFDGSTRQLQVNTRVQIPLSREAARGYEPLYRLREQSLADLLHRAQTNNARPGIVSFDQ